MTAVSVNPDFWQINLSDFSNFFDVQTKTAWGGILVEFASYCHPRPAFIILDIGCGPGLLPAIFAREGHATYGIDIDFALLSSSLFPNIVQADASEPPLVPSRFSLITATNVLFLLDDPLAALLAWRRLLTPDGELCLINPSEHLSISAATKLADSRSLDGTARESLLIWARNAETHFRWTETETQELLAQAGFQLEDSALRVGPGFARFTRAKLY